MTGIWKDMKHSYIIELKYAKGKDSDEQVARLREEAIAQANRYADTEVVKRNIGHTTLHKIVVVYKGMDMMVCEEIIWYHQSNTNRRKKILLFPPVFLHYSAKNLYLCTLAVNIKVGSLW